ncbi:folylpolyglutamate synthase/dihydrofolate synthase family protein [Neobacillus sp. FSL H8-0543]|uniref:bifunctional folylpolyglutamate synthase/dihydrofolate synthase n=1 Tax=Neobacillus sp. FSL H8-0543 TaxID=2954672 RepID=UPI00315846EC
MIKGFNQIKEKFDIHTKTEINLGLNRIENFLALLGNPHQHLKAVHIAGTNGKGSTLQFLRNILKEAGYSVGTFTSPHIEDVKDQISTNDGPITEEKLDETLNYMLSNIKDKKEIERLTDFELLTVLAIIYFSVIASQDIVIFETGMGGLTDSTNIISPLLSIITTISLEHTAYLGETLTDITYQKAGIIKKEIPCITGVKDEAALKVIREKAVDCHSKLYVLNEDILIADNGDDFTVQTPLGNYQHLQLAMKGNHQKENGSLAIMAAEVLNRENHFHIEKKHIKKGLKQTLWPGRFELVSESPVIILDGAHNPAAMERLVETLQQEYPNHKFQFIFGALRDKNTRVMIEMLDNLAEKITFVDFDFPRAASATQLASISSLANKHSSINVSESLSLEINQLKKEDILVLTGSLYLISEVRPILCNYLEK